MRKFLTALLITAASAAAPMQANAGMPVIDFAAVASLAQQLMAWQQQLSGMQRQYEQLQQSRQQLTQTYQAMTGSRGMEQLLPLPESARNYLPASYGELTAILDGGPTGYAGIAEQVRAIMKANSILSNAQMQSLNPEVRQIVEEGREASATFSALTQAAYQNTSQRFAVLQQLIQHIGRAQDAKAIADLQARIQSEQAMLTNEQTKLQSLYQIALSEEAARRQRIRERAAADIGSAGSLPFVAY